MRGTGSPRGANHEQTQSHLRRDVDAPRPRLRWSDGGSRHARRLGRLGTRRRLRVRHQFGRWRLFLDDRLGRRGLFDDRFGKRHGHRRPDRLQRHRHRNGRRFDPVPADRACSGRTVSDARSAGCPGVPPNAGTTCSSEGLECKYQCGQNGAVTCSGGMWEFANGGPCPISTRKAKTAISPAIVPLSGVKPEPHNTNSARLLP